MKCMLNYPYFLHCYDSTKWPFERKKGFCASHSTNILYKGRDKWPTVCSKTIISCTVTTYLPRNPLTACLKVAESDELHAQLSLLLAMLQLNSTAAGAKKKVFAPYIPLIFCTEVVKNGQRRALIPSISA